MTDHEFIESITSVCKALKDAQNLAETYRSAWNSQKDLNDELSCDITRLENERDRLREKLAGMDDGAKPKVTPWDGTTQTIMFTGTFADVDGDVLKATDGLGDSDGYIEDGGARNANA